MAFEAAAVAAALLALFSARRTIGLAPIYTTVGVIYYLATLLAGTTFVKVAPGLLVSPGSVALFPATLFAVLLIYIHEDAKEARNMIYGLLAANACASPLTGVYNRGFFDEMRCRPRSWCDHFKRINDSHGHGEGDRALRVIAQALAGAVRGSDIVCRYGGEEFAIILPGTSLEAGALLAHRVRVEVPAACARENVAGGARVTVTIGLASRPDDGEQGEVLVRTADRRLYRGKNAGRNRVMAA